MDGSGFLFEEREEGRNIADLRKVNLGAVLR
jgi:hypothetical protein